MREIKFRQRNKNNGQFHYWGMVDEVWVDPMKTANYVQPEESDQYTGFKDRTMEEPKERCRHCEELIPAWSFKCPKCKKLLPGNWKGDRTMGEYKIRDFEHKQRTWHKELPDGSTVEVTKMVTSNHAHNMKITIDSPKTSAGRVAGLITISGQYEDEIATTIAEMLLDAVASDIGITTKGEQDDEQ